MVLQKPNPATTQAHHTVIVENLEQQLTNTRALLAQKESHLAEYQARAEKQRREYESGLAELRNLQAED